MDNLQEVQNTLEEIKQTQSQDKVEVEKSLKELKAEIRYKSPGKIRSQDKCYKCLGKNEKDQILVRKFRQNEILVGLMEDLAEN